MKTTTVGRVFFVLGERLSELLEEFVLHVYIHTCVVTRWCLLVGLITKSRLARSLRWNCQLFLSYWFFSWQNGCDGCIVNLANGISCGVHREMNAWWFCVSGDERVGCIDIARSKAVVVNWVQ